MTPASARLLQPDTWFQILHQCDTLTIATLQLVSKQIFKTVSLYYTHVLKSRLKYYAEDVNSFLYVMAATQSVLSGSWMLKTILRDHVPSVNNTWVPEWEQPMSQDWEPKDLDLYMKGSSECRDIMFRFLTEQGYQEDKNMNDPEARWRRAFGNRPIPDGMTHEEMLQQLNYADPQLLARPESKIKAVSSWFKGNKRIDVIESASEASVDPIRAFHSTSVMNYAYFDSIAIAFPAFTLNGKNYRNAACNDLDWRIQSCIDKYTRRGFKLPKQDPYLCVNNVNLETWQNCVIWRIQLLPDMHEILLSDFAQSIKSLAKVSYNRASYATHDYGWHDRYLKRSSIVNSWAKRCVKAKWLLEGPDRLLAIAAGAHGLEEDATGMEVD